MQHTQITDGKGVRIPKSAHRDDLRGPRPHPRQCEQLAAGFTPVDSGIESQITAGQSGHHGPQRRSARPRHGQVDRVDVGQLPDGREEMGQRSGGICQRRPVRLHQPAGMHPGSGERHLLAQHRTHREFLGVDGSGNALSRRRRNDRA